MKFHIMTPFYTSTRKLSMLNLANFSVLSIKSGLIHRFPKGFIEYKELVLNTLKSFEKAESASSPLPCRSNSFVPPTQCVHSQRIGPVLQTFLRQEILPLPHIFLSKEYSDPHTAKLFGYASA